MRLVPQPTALTAKYSEISSASIPIPSLTTLSIGHIYLDLRSGNEYEDQDCTRSTTPPPTTTTSSTAGAAGAEAVPNCTVTKLSDAVIGLGVLCGISIIGCIVLLFLFIKQSKSSQDRHNRTRDNTSSHSHPSSPLAPWSRDHFRDFDTRSRRRRVYDGLGIGSSRDGRLHRGHSMHESPQARNPLARSPLAPPPRYMERAPENMPQPHNTGMFPRSPGRRGMFARSPLMAGYPFLRNPNINPMAFPQAQAGLGNMQMPQMPGHIHQQPPIYQQHVHQHQHPEQAGMMQPEHHHHAPVAMADMQAAQEQAQQRGSVRAEEGNIGRSRDPSNVGTAVRDDAFGRLRREVLGSRRASRSETEGSRGRRGGLSDGGPPVAL
ncbi:hypothetical protein IFR04_004199 [Cadophora malorum]|uniref:Mid2 domain-containing protein n=1 Tax=Cadophora malorum TaxID=108018 RepID=A0A8H8BSN0_9HELO|nr:hypothetical protein IFR04_004199 [Cadophora malorum]